MMSEISREAYGPPVEQHIVEGEIQILAGPVIEAVQEGPPILGNSDGVWLSTYGVSIDWDDGEQVDFLNGVVRIGSQKISRYTDAERRLQVIRARAKFMDLLDLDADEFDEISLRSPSLIPLGTLISSNRLMAAHGINPAKVTINHLQVLTLTSETIEAKLNCLDSIGLNVSKVVEHAPQLLFYTVDNIRAHFDELSLLGIEVVSAVNRNSKILSLSQGTIRNRMEHIASLGLDRVKVVQRFPGALNMKTDTVANKMSNLHSWGLDSVKIINSSPALLGLSQDTLNEKVENLTDLGLDISRVLETFPAILSYSTVTLQEKMRFIDRSVKVLRYGNDAIELVNAHPSLLGFSLKKLAVMRRIAASKISGSGREASVSAARSSLFIPLEKYMIALDHDDNVRDRLEDMSNDASRLKLDAVERKQRALEVARSGELGRIGTLYLSYKNIKS